VKSSKAKYILFPVVGLIWGLVILRYLGVFESDAELPPPPAASMHKVNLSEVESVTDTFTLHLNYRDPFLDKPRVVKEERLVNADVSPNSNHTPTQPAPIVDQAQKGFDWASVRYNGLVKVTGNTDPVGLMQINGQTVFVRNHELRGAIEIIKLYEDSVVVRLIKEKSFHTLRK
jgi:hypothetical protein